MCLFKRKRKAEVVEEIAPVETPVETEVAEQKPLKTWIVNCVKCGAALSLKEGGQAYICPVCGMLLRVKTGTKLVKDLGAEDKKYHVTLTEAAMKSIMEKETQSGVGAVIGANVVNGYENGDGVVIDVNENGEFVKKA